MDCWALSTALYALLGYTIYKLLDRLVRLPKIGNLEKRHILVTGCDTGFGNAIAKRLDKLGCHVYACCFTEKGETDLKKSTSDRLKTFHMNVADSGSVRKGYEFVKNHLPADTGLWGVINNAGIVSGIGPLEWLKNDDYNQVFAVNLVGLIDVSTTFLPLVKKAKGRIVNTSSIFGRFSMPGSTPYTVSKYGVECFSDSMRRQMRDFDVSVHLIEPGYHKTNLLETEAITRSLRAAWEHAPAQIKEDYGEEFLEQSVQRVLEQLVSGWFITSDISGVVNAYEHALLGKFPRARYVIGFDAKFVWLPLQHMPEWMGDWLLDNLNRKKPVPAVLKK